MLELSLSSTTASVFRQQEVAERLNSPDADVDLVDAHTFVTRYELQSHNKVESTAVCSTLNYMYLIEFEIKMYRFIFYILTVKNWSAKFQESSSFSE